MYHSFVTFYQKGIQNVNDRLACVSRCLSSIFGSPDLSLNIYYYTTLIAYISSSFKPITLSIALVPMHLLFHPDTNAQLHQSQ
jgi:hypothetical protein